MHSIDYARLAVGNLSGREQECGLRLLKPGYTVEVVRNGVVASGGVLHPLWSGPRLTLSLIEILKTLRSSRAQHPYD